MNKHDDGGQAFPSSSTAGGGGEYYAAHMPGMTLRDYFAAKAMAAVITSPFPETSLPCEIAETAYLMADAMLKERAK